MKGKDFTPLIMWFCLLAGIVALSFTRSGRMPGIWNEYPLSPDTIFIGLYVVWMLVESRVSGKDVNTGGKTRSDSASCQVYGTAQALTFLTALWFPPVWRGPNPAHFLGITFFVLGVCYRLWAVRTLGRFYSHRVQTMEGHRIVDSGPYRRTRHPAYAGMILANAGITLYFFNRVTLCVFLFMLVPAILFRIAIEERTLFQIREYSEFAKKRKRLIPKVW